MEDMKEMIENEAKKPHFNVVYCRSVVTGKGTLAYLPSGIYIRMGEYVEIGNVLYKVLLRQDFLSREDIKNLQELYGRELEEVTGSYSRDRIVWEGVRE